MVILPPKPFHLLLPCQFRNRLKNPPVTLLDVVAAVEGGVDVGEFGHRRPTPKAGTLPFCVAPGNGIATQ